MWKQKRERWEEIKDKFISAVCWKSYWEWQSPGSGPWCQGFSVHWRWRQKVRHSYFPFPATLYILLSLSTGARRDPNESIIIAGYQLMQRIPTRCHCAISQSVRLHALRRPEQNAFLSVTAVMVLADRDLGRTLEDVCECFVCVYPSRD